MSTQELVVRLRGGVTAGNLLAAAAFWEDDNTVADVIRSVSSSGGGLWRRKDTAWVCNGAPGGVTSIVVAAEVAERPFRVEVAEISGAVDR